jgi:hypothetical protein
MRLGQGQAARRSGAGPRSVSGANYEPSIEEGVGANKLPAPNGSWAPLGLA